MSAEGMSWAEVAERDAKGLCPASPGYDQPHIVADDGGTCKECGATVSRTPEIPEDRVRAFLDAHREYGGDGDLYDMVDGDQIITLTASDVRDVLNELDSYRTDSEQFVERMETMRGHLQRANDEADSYRTELEEARARIAELERAPEWKVGDPDPTPDLGYGNFCEACAPEPQNGYCTWAPGHTEAQHVAGNGEVIVAVWDVDVPTDPAPQGDPITSITD